ncbi:CMT1A duplicated region transcript 1 protein-like [Protopterus annectens]|uniref:CMT1A duplicated region transcript 1 protein-like n=1 Tax=Protopterus annectens TaxID=7888 RepID=UPI001CFBBA62|nr:CMT1A duplicated region transcript 1 protein-like [Protopterus annectens]
MPEIDGGTWKIGGGTGLELRCMNGCITVCGVCESCLLVSKLCTTKEWFSRSADASQRRFMMGLVRKLNNLDILEKLEQVLLPDIRKDFTYTRSRTNPGLPEDSGSLSSDRALDQQLLQKQMLEAWDWFSRRTYWTKLNYLLVLFQLCDSQLLYAIGNLIRVLLIREKSLNGNKSKDQEDKDNDGLSIPESQYSFRTSDHSELELLVQASSKYKPVSPALFPEGLGSAAIEDASDEISTVEPAIPASFTLSNWFPDGEKHCKVQRLDKSDASSISADDPALFTVPTGSQSTSGISKYKDFIRCLPVHLSKYILGFLDKRSLITCQHVSQHWSYLVEEMLQDAFAQQLVQDEAMILQGTSPKGVSATYAKIRDVFVPRISEKGETIPLGGNQKNQKMQPVADFFEAYIGLQTGIAKIEERNIYCGSYNVLILKEQEDSHRVIHFSGGSLVAMGSSDRKVRFFDLMQMKEVPPLIKGHAGSVTAIHVCEDRGIVLSGSFDLSIRCWCLETGDCLRIYQGHTGTIKCLDVYENKLVSGAKDRQVKVWNLETGRCARTFKHKDYVLAVKIDQDIVVSGCKKGQVKLWHIKSATLLKMLDGHQGPVTCLSFDQWHLASGSADGYVKLWSMLGKFQGCLMTFRHPKAVLCLKFLYGRVISGCADGKIRIFNVFSGDCLRMIRVNNRSDPILSFSVIDNRIVINAVTRVLLFQFEEVQWDYSQETEREKIIKDRDRYKRAPLRKQPYPYVRAERMKRIGSTNVKIYHHREDSSEGTESRLSHHARSLTARSMKAAKIIQQESMRPATWTELQSYRRSRAYIDLQPEFRTKPPSAIPSMRSPSQSYRETFSRASSASPPVARAESDKESISKSALSASEQATLQRMKKRGPYHPKTPDQILLSVNTLQTSQKQDELSSNTKVNMFIREAWGVSPPPSQEHMERSSATKHSPSYEENSEMSSAVKHKTNNQTAISQLKSAATSLDMTKSSIPFETRELELDLKHSMHGHTVKSHIPKPSVTRLKTSLGFREQREHIVTKRRSLTPARIWVENVGNFTTNAEEAIQMTKMVIGTSRKAQPQWRSKPQPSDTVDPYRIHSGFKLLTVTQQQEHEAKIKFQQSESQKKILQDKNKECKKAWLRKIKGLPIENFTKQGKVAAPELGPDTYI